MNANASQTSDERPKAEAAAMRAADEFYRQVEWMLGREHRPLGPSTPWELRAALLIAAHRVVRAHEGREPNL